MEKEIVQSAGNLINNKSSTYKNSLDKLVTNMATISRLCSSKIQSIGFSYFQTQKKLIDSLQAVYSPMMRTIHQLQEGFKPLYESMQNMLNSISKVDLNPVVSFYNNIKYFNFNISSQQEKGEIVQDISLATTEIIKSEKITTREKRNIFKTFFSKLTGVIKTLFILIILPLLLSEVVPNQIAIYEARQEISQLEQGQKHNEVKLEYRYITHKAKLYKNIKLKTKIDDLEVGEIVIVLEKDKEKIKVQILDTEEIGWILKKYSKRKWLLFKHIIRCEIFNISTFFHIV